MYFTKSSASSTPAPPPSSAPISSAPASAIATSQAEILFAQAKARAMRDANMVIDAVATSPPPPSHRTISDTLTSRSQATMPGQSQQSTVATMPGTQGPVLSLQGTIPSLNLTPRNFDNSYMMQGLPPPTSRLLAEGEDDIITANTGGLHGAAPSSRGHFAFENMGSVSARDRGHGEPLTARTNATSTGQPMSARGPTPLFMTLNGDPPDETPREKPFKCVHLPSVCVWFVHLRLHVYGPRQTYSITHTHAHACTHTHTHTHIHTCLRAIYFSINDKENSWRSPDKGTSAHRLCVHRHKQHTQTHTFSGHPTQQRCPKKNRPRSRMHFQIWFNRPKVPYPHPNPSRRLSTTRTTSQDHSRKRAL